MSIPTMVAKIISDAQLSANMIVYNKQDRIAIGYVREIKKWKLMYVSNGQAMESVDSYNCEELLAEAFRVMETRGTRLVVMVNDIGKEY